MKRSLNLPTMFIAILTGLLAIASYPSMSGAQGPRVEPRRLFDVIPVNAPNLPAVVGQTVVGQTGGGLATTVPFGASKIVNDGITWRNLSAPIRLRHNDITIHGFGGAATDDIKVNIAGRDRVDLTFKAIAGWSKAVQLDPNEGPVQTIRLKLDKPNSPDVAFTVSLPNPNDKTKPTVRKVTNQRYFDGYRDPESPSTAIMVFRSFMGFLVDPASGFDDLEVQFYIASADGLTAVESPGETLKNESSRGVKEIHIRLPRDFASAADDRDHFAQIRTKVGPNELHSYSRPVKFRVNNNPTTPNSVGSISIKGIKDDGTEGPALVINERLRAFPFNGKSVLLEGVIQKPNDAEIVIFRDDSSIPDPVLRLNRDNNKWNVRVENMSHDKHSFSAAFAQGEEFGPKTTIPIVVRSLALRAVSVDPEDFGSRPNKNTITVQFERGTLLNEFADADAAKSKFLLANVTDTAKTNNKVASARLDESRSAVVLTTAELIPGRYTLSVNAGIKDIFGNESTKAETFNILMPIGSDLPSVAPGGVNPTGPYVPFKEYTKPRVKPEGFNPGDHVETRVVRLYYFRDAHRVAQILNRDAKSWNRIAVDTRRRLSDQARVETENQSLRRKVFERDAVQAAQETRVQEQRLKAAQEQLLDADKRRADSEKEIERLRIISGFLANDEKRKADKAEVDQAGQRAEAKLNEANGDIEKARSRVNEARGALQGAQTAESQKRESWQSSLELEDKMKADQFRLGVAAMHEDPDTYAPGKPKSSDPVQQVSISVLGESEIHLRGPISGINIIREMINQIDAPTGQVRVAIHTVQINGERQDKMESVSADIQSYIDQSRFLTQQSSLMLRKAVFKVATRKAWMAKQVGPFDSQKDRDERYLHSFFGKDFIMDLQTQRSEFLSSGNKLLSLNSMDTTSLASTLFILALAKNDTRQEILTEFKQMLATDLPMMEQSFYEAGGPRGKTKSTHFNFGCFPKKQCYELMAGNARFQSLLGFFDADAEGSPDTLTPVQREFLKLAQILKSRLVTELEFKQRVMERALVEDRGGGNYLKELKKAAEDERASKDAFASTLQKVREQQNVVSIAALKLSALLESMKLDSDDVLLQVDPEDVANAPLQLPKSLYDGYISRRDVKATPDFIWLKSRLAPKVKVRVTFLQEKSQATLKFENQPDLDIARTWANEMLSRFNEAQATLAKWDFSKQAEAKYRFDRANEALVAFKKEVENSGTSMSINIRNFASIPGLQKQSFYYAKENANFYSVRLKELLALLNADRVQTQKAFLLWINISDIKDYVSDTDWKNQIKLATGEVNASFDYLLKAEGERRVAAQNADLSRRPLDHKKMLDMLIDEIHDKYVELLEGTRAYTANIDDYIKRVATALDDDFNTQFYQPAFRRVRTTATSWDVSLGAVETTSILTNNRTYAKVDPQATMEFDLPRRNIVITEAFQATKGLVDTYGALMQDPTFLNLTRISAGMPTSTQALGSNSGVPAIRSVLPGMSRLTDESVMAQSGTSAKSFGTPLDALVPDPAIYKFETGTSYEIRPVIAPDGQSVNFHFNYMYSMNIREPVRADEKHLGRVKRHYIDTNVQLGNYELREISKYQVALRAARTGKGVPLLQDIPGVGVLFRPLPSAESSLQQNVILGQSTIFPTLFDLMGLRWAPSVADLDPLTLDNANFVVRQRKQFLTNRVFDYSSSRVDEALQIPDGERRGDLYRSQQTVPYLHPNGYKGPGMGLRDSQLRENYDPKDYYPPSGFAPGSSGEGRVRPQGPMIPGMPYYHDGHMLPPGIMMPGMPHPNYGHTPSEGMSYPQTIPPKVPAPSQPPFQPIPREMKSPQGMSSSPTSLFATDRLTTAGSANSGPIPTPERMDIIPAAATTAPAAPAAPRTLWTKMFGNR